MVTYTHNHKSPVEAKIMLLLGMCGARASEFSYDDWGESQGLCENGFCCRTQSTSEIF